MSTTTKSLKRNGITESGVFSRILHYYRLLHKELGEERRALKNANFSLLKSSQHRQALLQKEIDDYWGFLQKRAKNADFSTKNEENFSTLTVLQQQIDAQIKANLQLALMKKQQIKVKLGKAGQGSHAHRKNFPKFSYLSPPEIVDIRR